MDGYALPAAISRRRRVRFLFFFLVAGIGTLVPLAGGVARAAGERALKPLEWLEAMKAARSRRRLSRVLTWTGLGSAVLPGAITVGLGYADARRETDTGLALRVTGFAILGLSAASLAAGIVLSIRSSRRLRRLLDNQPSLAREPLRSAPPPAQVAPWRAPASTTWLAWGARF